MKKTRNKIIRFRVNEEELERIKELAEQYKMTVSQFLRHRSIRRRSPITGR